MVTRTPRLALDASRTVDRMPATNAFEGAWWPRTRTLAAELPELFALWPQEAGQIASLTYCPADWVDRPSAVTVPRRRGALRTSGAFDDPQGTVTLTMLHGRHRVLALIRPETSERIALRRLSSFDGRHRP